jgi:hypothetical protein
MPAADTLMAARKPRRQHADTAQQLVVAWQHPEMRLIEPVGFLTYDGYYYRFAYIRNALDVKDFRPLLGFADLHGRYVSKTLFPLFAQRAMDPRRPDYHSYLGRLGLGTEAGPLEQIARSQGRRQGDTLQLLPVPHVHGGELRFLFLVNGVRHIPDRALAVNEGETRVSREEVEAALARLQPGAELGIVKEPGNPVNPLAVVVTASSVPVGWVPDLLVEDVRALMDRAAVSVTTEHVNGPDAPWHLRLLARLRAAGAGEFRFFTGPKWQLLDSADQ